MNPSAILELISDIYGQMVGLQQENALLKRQIAEAEPAATDGESTSGSSRGPRAGRTPAKTPHTPGTPAPDPDPQL